jgi:hypothetical protein
MAKKVEKEQVEKREEVVPAKSCQEIRREAYLKSKKD